jgi:hypothetical protein
MDRKQSKESPVFKTPVNKILSGCCWLQSVYPVSPFSFFPVQNLGSSLLCCDPAWWPPPCSLSLSFLFFHLQKVKFSVWLRYSWRPPPLVSPILFFPFTKFASSLCCAVVYHAGLPPVSPLFTLQSFESSLLCCYSWRRDHMENTLDLGPNMLSIFGPS